MAEKSNFAIEIEDPIESPQQIALEDEIRGKVDDFLTEFNGSLPNTMELEFEGFYRRGFFVTKNKSAMINTVVSRCQHYKLIYNETKKLDLEKCNEFLNGMNHKEIYKRVGFLNLFLSKERNDNILFFKEIKNYILDSKEDTQNIKTLVNQLSLLDNVVERLLKNANQDLVYLDLARNWK